MKVKVKNNDYDLHYGNRLYIIYENAMNDMSKEMGKEIDPNSRISQTTLVYATLQATLKYNKVDETLTFDDVNDIIDENGGMAFLVKFSKWFSEKVEAETALIRKETEPKEDKPTNKKKSRT